MQHIFNIKYTTPGAIAGSAVWTIWVFSADTMFGRVGDVTGINYYHRYNEYLAKILEGFQRRQHPNFGDGVQEDAENVQAELAAATDVLTNMLLNLEVLMTESVAYNRSGFLGHVLSTTKKEPPEGVLKVSHHGQYGSAVANVLMSSVQPTELSRK
ncbi:hypothetical protein B0H14DRAFT_2565505 [Mycena olivaceomarginata]|nr:hypothetical protein B0H14DRAFT_2565505 [Mycena olivaceomarginata]